MSSMPTKNQNQNQDERGSINNSGFDKLRLRVHRRAIAGAAAGAAALGLAGQAQGVTIAASGISITFGGVEYTEISNSSIFSPLTTLPGATGDRAWGISDATTASGGDAFDGFAGITVNGVAFNQPNNMVDFATTGDGGFLTTITPADIGGIDTSLDYFFDDSSPTARVFATFTNNNANAESVEVAYGGDLGSDGNTTLEDTSTGDSTFESGLDRWIISSDDGDGDPVLTFVRFGQGGVQVASSTPEVPEGDNDLFADIWTLALNPGETQSLLWYVQLNPSLTLSQAGTADFDSLAALSNAGLLAGLTDTQINQAVNWVPPAAPPQTAVPEPASPLLMGMALVAVAGVVWFRRSWRAVTA